MKSTDTITVLMCCHSTDKEHDKLLLKALESLCNQTYKNFDVVLVLDECWEQTFTELEGFFNQGHDLNIQIHERPHKKGLANAKNFGLKFCTGDWIAYLDAA
jgi:glycosyltransferase involved in cell wall biosynthesis